MRLTPILLTAFVALSMFHVQASAEEPQKGRFRGFLETFASELQKGAQQRQASQAQPSEATQPVQRTEEMTQAQQPAQEGPQAWQARVQEEHQKERERANQELEERYAKAKNAAFIVMTENAVVDADSVEDACKMLLGDMSITREQYDAFLPRCVSDVNGQKGLLRADLLAGKKKPTSCKQWALMRNESWQSAKHDMRYGPMSQSNRPVRFSGIVMDGNSSQLLIQNTSQYSGQTEAAYINAVPTSTVLNKDNIKVGNRVSGYGVHASRKANILVINGFCLE